MENNPASIDELSNHSNKFDEVHDEILKLQETLKQKRKERRLEADKKRKGYTLYIANRI